MGQVTRQGFGPDGRPLCFNREPMRGYAANDGYDEFGRLRRVVIPWAFSEGCRSWVADPSTDPVPLAEGWRCGGCTYFPGDYVDLALTRRHDRKMREGK